MNTITTDKVDNHVRKFTDNACPLGHLANAPVYKVMDSICKGVKPDTKLLYSVFSELLNPNTYRYGIYDLMGWTFDFTTFEKMYFVKLRGYRWRQVNALNKTMVRQCSAHKSAIVKICEIVDA